jgi:enoyl-CoA hydratase
MSLVEYSKKGAVACLKLDRPDKLNAITREMLDEIGEQLSAAEADDDVRAIVLHGEGRAFSAGYDLDFEGYDDGDAEAQLRADLRKDFDAVMRFWNFPKPVVAAVHGYCLGYAMEIAAACDIVIAAEGCRFGAPEARFGSGIICMLLPWMVGQKHARELLLVGSDRVDATRAAEIGLVNRVVAADRSFEEALATAGEIALNDPVSVRLTKKALNLSAESAGMLTALEQALEIDVEIESTETPESIEFNRILDEEGPKAAIAWRASRLPKGMGD